jgi:hypothetical protein
MGRLAVGIRVGSLRRPFSEAREDRRASETGRNGLARRLFGFQNVNTGYYQQVRGTGTPKKLLLLFGSLVFVLFLAESVLRFFPLLRPHPRTYVGEYNNRQRRSRWVATDPLLGRKIRPNAPQINAQGFRAPFDFHPNQDCKGIAFAGASFTSGVGVKSEKTFASLTQAGATGSCAYNMGVPGFGLDQEWLTVRTQALPLRPRLVVVVFTSSDWMRSQEAYNPGFGPKPVFKLAEGRLVPETAEDRPNFLLRFLQHHSSVWRLMQLADLTLARRYPHGEWWYLNAAILDAIREDCRKAGVPVLFVYIPTGWRAFPSLRAYMFRNQANFIDLSQGAFTLTPDMYIPRDGHLNDKGHRRVADAILRWAQVNPALGAPGNEGMLVADNPR